MPTLKTKSTAQRTGASCFKCFGRDQFNELTTPPGNHLPEVGSNLTNFSGQDIMGSCIGRDNYPSGFRELR